MKILTATHLALAAAVTATLVFVVAAITYHTRLQDSISDRQMLYSITQGVAELQIRTGEYLNPNHFDLRPLYQWRVRDAAIQGALSYLNLKGDVSHREVSSLIMRHNEIRQLFNRLVELHGPDESSIVKTQKLRLLGRLFVMFEEQLADADELRRETLAADMITFNRMMMIGVMILSLLLGAVIFAVATVRRSMSTPMQRLLEATKALGDGRLDHRIGDAPPNEIGVLANAIDTMAERLQSVTSSRDELKQVEEALRRLNETLEERVAARTAELQHTHEQLRQAQKMEAVGQLTGGIAHDFNNLLAGIVGNLEMMRIRISQGRTGELPRYIDSMMGVSQRAASLTHRLLAFSRRQTLDPKATDIGRLILSMKDLIERTVGPAIRLTVVSDEALWITLCDAHQLENTLLNLAINARDAMGNGGQLTIEARNITIDDTLVCGQLSIAPGQYVTIAVADTGSGMTPEVLARVFDPFFTTKPIGQGTGLGLPMIYGFVKQSGGYIWIDSIVDMGSRVWIYLPRFVGCLPVNPLDTTPVAARTATTDMTILMVDDEPEVRTSSTEILEELGYTIIQATDGNKALEVLRSQRHIDLMITDIGLPGGLNGYQLAEKARMLWPELKILFITGYAQNTMTGSKALAPGMEVLRKPFDMGALANKVSNMLVVSLAQS